MREFVNSLSEGRLNPKPESGGIPEEFGNLNPFELFGSWSCCHGGEEAAMTQTATSRPLTLVASVPQKPRLQAFASIASPGGALQWSSYLHHRELRSGKRDSCSANKVSVCGESTAKNNFCAHLLHGKEDGYLVDGAQQSVLSSCLQEPRREGRIWWRGSQQQNEKKTQQLGIWRTKAERRDSLGVEADWEREEARWLREEQRWLREEERWRREEARWTEERKAWVQESLAMAEEIKVVRKKVSLQISLQYVHIQISGGATFSNTQSKAKKTCPTPFID